MSAIPRLICKWVFSARVLAEGQLRNPIRSRMIAHRSALHLSFMVAFARSFQHAVGDQKTHAVADSYI